MSAIPNTELAVLIQSLATVCAVPAVVLGVAAWLKRSEK